VGSGAKSPSSLAPFADDWVGGDIHGLSAYAGTLYRYVPEITDVTKALNSKVSAIVNAAGWQGSAAASFSKAWERDSTAATALAVAISGCGDVVNTLAVNLANIESALEQAADKAKAHGVPIGANGEPPQVCLANATAESWRIGYQGFWNQCMRSAAEARTEAAGALQSLYGQLAPDPAKDGGLGKGDYTALFDVLAGFWGAQTRYRGFVESKIPGLKNAVARARTTAIEDARQANGQFGPWSEEDRQMFGDAGTKLAGVQGQLDGAESTENLWSKTWGFSPSDIPGVSDAIDGASGLTRLAAGVPFVDIAAVGASTYFGAQDDIANGVPAAAAYPLEGTGSLAALGTGAVVGNLAMDGTAAGLGALGAGGAGLTIAVGGAGVLAGGVVAYGVGDFAHNLINENWSQDWAQNGAVLGTLDGIGDSAVKTGGDIVNVGKSIWHGITSFL
jgi:uncharacterized protein YukE